MAFRRAKSDAHRRMRSWQDWIDAQRAELAAIGLPAEVYLDEPRWHDFLQNGYLEWHASTGFEFTNLSQTQMAALCRFLEREYGGDAQPPSLLGYLRTRLGGCQ
jgi:hypothetical protein